MSVAYYQPKRTLDKDRPLSIAEFAELSSETPEGPVRHELDKGRLVTMPPPGVRHGKVEANLVFALRLYGDRRGLGKVFSGEVGIILRRNPDRVVGADAAFVTRDSLPVRVSPEGYFEVCPDVIIEVVSKHDRLSRVIAKVNEYLDAGARIVVVVDPQQGTVSLHRPARQAEVLRGDDEIHLEDVIPGFELTVADALAD